MADTEKSDHQIGLENAMPLQSVTDWNGPDDPVCIKSCSTGIIQLTYFLLRRIQETGQTARKCTTWLYLAQLLSSGNTTLLIRSNVVSANVRCSPFGSSVYTPGHQQVMQEFGVSQEISLLPFSFYLLGLSFGESIK